MLEYIKEMHLIEINKSFGYHPLNSSLVGSALSSWHHYSTIEQQITSVFVGIVKNHAFNDGNKRTACSFYNTVSNLFNLKTVSEDELFDIVIHVATNKESIPEISLKLFPNSK